MPTRTVKNHHNVIEGVSRGHFIEKHLHAFAIDAGQNERVEFTRINIHRSKRIGVLMGEHRGADWADRLGCPGVAHIVDTTKARLVLEHEFDRCA